jgi:hypothetical protein
MRFVTGQVTLDADTLDRPLPALAASRCVAAGKAAPRPAAAGARAGG